MKPIFPTIAVMLALGLLAVGCGQTTPPMPAPAPHATPGLPTPAVVTMTVMPMPAVIAMPPLPSHDVTSLPIPPTPTDLPAPAVAHTNSTSTSSSVQTTPEAPPQPEQGREYEYTAQAGDALEAVARRFSTPLEVIRAANPGLSSNRTFLPLGLVVDIPGIDLTKYSKPDELIPDSELVYGPGQRNFDLEATVAAYSGWLSTSLGWNGKTALAPAWEVVAIAATNYSINPRLLLALLEHQTGLLTGTTDDEEIAKYPYGVRDWQYAQLDNQLIWVAQKLNAGYYGWRSGRLTEIRLADGLIWPLDPRLNAGTVALYFSIAPLYATAEFEDAIGPDGFITTYKELFGNPFSYEEILISPDLQQPPLELPFEPEVVWNFTGGPHDAWRDSLPWAAIDFAPQLAYTGCQDTDDWVTAAASGYITRIQDGVVALNLGPDGSEQTGWTIVHVHLRPDLKRIRVGQWVEVGYRFGHPSCEGQLRATSTHLHLARKYNGEWIEADGPVPFNLGGWIAEEEHRPYRGKLIHESTREELVACSCAVGNQIWRPRQ